MAKELIQQLVKEAFEARKRAILKEKLRKVIVPLIQEEIRTFRSPTRYVEDFTKALKAAAGDWCTVTTNVNQDRIIFDDGESGSNFSVELDIVGLNNFTIVYRLGNVKQRGKVYNLSDKDVKDFIKDHLKGRKEERDKQPKIEKKIKGVTEVDDVYDEESEEVKKPETQQKKADESDKAAKKSADAKKPKVEEINPAFSDATKFKKQEDAKDKAEIAKGGKVSKAKEMDSDEEKKVKSTKKNFAQ
jgi:hypothetical protein